MLCVQLLACRTQRQQPSCTSCNATSANTCVPFPYPTLVAELADVATQQQRAHILALAHCWWRRRRRLLVGG